MNLLGLKGEKELEKELLSQVKRSLHKKQSECTSYDEAWKKKMHSRLPIFHWTEQSLFRTLNRHFEGKTTPGLPTTLRIARSLATRLKAINKRFL